MKRMIFSIMTMASSTTNPVEIVSAMSVRLFTLYPSRYITPNVPTSDSGTATLGMIVARRFRRNAKITSTTRTTVSPNSNSTSATEARIVTVRSVRFVICTDAGMDAFNCGSSFLIPSTTEMMLAPGCALDIENHRRLAVHPRRFPHVLDPVDNVRHVRQPNRSAPFRYATMIGL